VVAGGEANPKAPNWSTPAHRASSGCSTPLVLLELLAVLVVPVLLQRLLVARRK